MQLELLLVFLAIWALSLWLRFAGPLWAYSPSHSSLLTPARFKMRERRGTLICR